MLDQRGTVFLTDFGIAKLLESSGGNKETIPQFTPTGAITGTPDYMSPEQAQGLHLDQRSDIYSVGIVLFEMLTGKVPFDAETPIAVIMKHISEPLPRPSVFNPNIHPALEGVVVKALEKSPAARFASMHAFKLAWENALLEMAQGTAAQGTAAQGTAKPDAAAKKSLLYQSPENPTPNPATPTPMIPAGGALHSVEDDSIPGKNTPPKIKVLPPAGSPSSPSSQAWTPAVNGTAAVNGSLAQGTEAENSSPMKSAQSGRVHPSPSTLGPITAGGVGAGYSGAGYSGDTEYIGNSDEDNIFLLRNLQLSKIASSRVGTEVGEGYSGAEYSEEHRFRSKASKASQSSQAHQSSMRILWIAGGVALAILVIIVLATALNVFDFIREARQIPVEWIP